MTGDGSAVLSGRCEGYWNTASAGALDFAAVKLDADGNELWRWQVRESYFIFKAAVEEGTV